MKIRPLDIAHLGDTGLRLASGLLGAVRRPAFSDKDAAPELIQSAVIDGVLMRWEEHGSDTGGPSVVLVHGIPTGPRLWRYVIPRLQNERAHCFAWEMVGFGSSSAEGLGRDVSVARQAEYLYAWLRHLKIERPVLVGHDLGGGVLQRLVTTHPEACSALVLADCIAYDNWPIPSVRAARAASSALERLPPAMLKPVVFSALLNLGHDRADRWTESAQLHWRHYAAPAGPRALAHQLRHLDVRDTLAVADKLRECRLPARVVWGEADPLGLASAKRLADDLRAPLRELPRARHFTPEDHPEILAEEIQAAIGASLQRSLIDLH